MGLLKHYKNWGFSQFCGFLLLKEKKKANKKNDNWNFWFWVFVGPKMAVSWGITAFQKNLAETPIFIVFLGARFLGQVVKKGKFSTPTKKKEKFDW